MSLYWLFLFCFVSYLIGNINISIIITRARKKNIYAMASGNPGAMNMLRNFGFKVGVLVLLFDVAKGAVPALIGFFAFGGGIEMYTNTSQIALYACGMAVMLGHCFPVFLGFKGGKGFASMMGVFFVAHPLVSLAAFAGMAIYIAVFEYGAMASFMYVTVMVIYASLQPINSNNITVCCLLFAFYFLTWYTHRTNIERLLTGRENSVTYLKGIHKKNAMRKQKRWLVSLRLGNNKMIKRDE